MAVFLAALVALLAAGEAQSQTTDELSALHDRVSRLHGQGKYAEAMPIAESYVALARQTYGEEHTEFATAIFWLAELYQDQGRTAEAEPLYKRTLAIREQALGPDHPTVAALYLAQGRYGGLFLNSPASRRWTNVICALLHPTCLAMLSPVTSAAPAARTVTAVAWARSD